MTQHSESTRTVLGGQLTRRGFILGAAGAAAMATTVGIGGAAGPAGIARASEAADATFATETPYAAVQQADLVVVGAGGAGMSAAAAAVEAGAQSVIILETTGRTGGELNVTSGSLSAARTIVQMADGLDDNIDLYVEDILRNSADMVDDPDPALIRMYAESAGITFQWLWDHGMSDYEFTTDSEGHRAVLASEHELYSVARTYKVKPQDRENYSCAAHELMDTYVKGEPKISILFETTAVELVPNEKGQVVGVVATDNADGTATLYLSAHGIVMATGGFGANLKLLKDYSRHGADYVTGCLPACNGRGLQMMQKMGAYLHDMKAISASPMGLQVEGAPGIGRIGGTDMCLAGGISVNKNGERFMNECDPSSAKRVELLELQPESVQYDIFTDKIRDDLAALGADGMYRLCFGGEDAYGYWLLKSADTLEGLAKEIGVPADALQTTVDSYNAAVDAGTTDEFGRPNDENFDLFRLCNNRIEGGKFYAVPMKPIVNTTPGGIRTDLSMRVLDETDTPIPGLYAAGEVMFGCSLGASGSGVMSALTYGRTAGGHATGDKFSDTYTIKPASEVLADSYFD